MTASRTRVLLTGELNLWLLTTARLRIDQLNPGRNGRSRRRRRRAAAELPERGIGASKDERDGCPQPPDDPSHASIIGHFSPQCWERPGELLALISRQDRQQGSRGAISPPQEPTADGSDAAVLPCSEYSFPGLAVSKGDRDTDRR